MAAHGRLNKQHKRDRQESKKAKKSASDEAALALEDANDGETERKGFAKSSEPAIRPISAMSSSGQAKSEGQGDPVKMLEQDHRKVEKLFEEYEKKKDEDSNGKLEIARRVCLELIVHASLEEEIFYPACRAYLPEDLLDEAQVEHDTAKALIAELLDGSPGDQFFDAKVKVLSEYIKHHVAEEEKARDGIFAKAKAAGLVAAQLAERLQTRKRELQAQTERRMEAPPTRSFFAMANQPREREGNMPRQSNMRERDEHGRFISDDRDDRDYDRGGRRSSSRGRDDDDRSMSSSGRSRDESGRFMSDDDDRGGYRGRGGRDEWENEGGGDYQSRGGRGEGRWFGDSEGHSEASRRGWDEREGGRGDYGYSEGRGGMSRGGRGGNGGHGGWFGDPERHTEASRRGWDEREGGGRGGDNSGRGGSSGGGRGGNGGGDYDRGQNYSSRGGRGGNEGHGGWFGDPEGHAEAARRGWEEREGGRGGQGGGRGRGGNDSERGGRGGNQGQDHGGWFGDPEGHSEAARRGWRDR